MMKSLDLMMMVLMMLTVLNLIINIFPTHDKSIHPIIMGLMLLIFLISSSLSIEIYSHFNWMSYLMFLIIIGGLMIIFLYFTSFISNMKMSFKWEYIKMLPLKFIMVMVFIFFILLNLKFNFPWFNNSMELLFPINSFNIKINTMYMYLYNKNYSMLMCMIYLLVTLMFIVKICINKKMSLRKIN